MNYFENFNEQIEILAFVSCFNIILMSMQDETTINLKKSKNRKTFD